MRKFIVTVEELPQEKPSKVMAVIAAAVVVGVIVEMVTRRH